MRIINGRVGKDCNVGNYTCFTHNGESTVDYVITSHCSFDILLYFCVHNFNIFSNHTPISFNLRVNNAQSETSMWEERVIHKWNSEFKDSFIHDVGTSTNNLCSSLEDNMLLDCDSDRLVNIFTDFLSSKGNAYFEKHIRYKKNVFSNDNSSYSMKKWFDESCKQKKMLYEGALRNYNLNKNDENRKEFLLIKKDFKYHCRITKRKYNRQLAKELENLKNKKPKEFWKLFKHKTSGQSNNSDIELCDFFEHFKTLSSDISIEEDTECQNFVNDYDMKSNECIYDELDEPFTIMEIRKCIKKLGSNKACSTDNIMYEYFKECIDCLDKPFQILFNYILDKKTYPKSWSQGLIVPIHKKGDRSDPNNYRGITLTSCFAKLFTSLINERLKIWSVKYDVISDAQFGFKANFSTVDAIFLLNSFIQKQFRDKKQLFCCFIDLQKCFDSIYRNGLWFKLIKQGVTGKVLSLIRSLYEDVKLCVKHLNNVSDLFDCNVGLLQGETMSPILFSLFVNDIELFLQQNTAHDFTLGQLSIYLLLFADDSVLISDTEDGLQSLLDAFELYCKKWKLTVNAEKTKIVVFQKGRKAQNRYNFKYRGKSIEQLPTFNYLGIVFTSNGTFHNAIKTLVGKANRALSDFFTITRCK